MMTKSDFSQAEAELLLSRFFDEAIDRTCLDNGLVSVVKPDDAAGLVSVQVWVKTGSIHEGECLGSGLSHFLEHMLFKGTCKRLGPEIAAEVQRHGGNMNAYTTFDRTVYYIDIPSEYAEVAMDVLSDAVLGATLPDGEIEKEKDVILREIDMGLDDPDTVLFQELFSTAFREHPCRHPVIGYRDMFKAVTREDLLAYYRTRYLPNNIAVVFAGDVPSIEAGELVNRYFGEYPRGRLAPSPVAIEPEQLSRRENHLFRDVRISRASLAFKIPGLFHEDAPGLDILASVLGRGKSSIFWKRLRDREGKVHDIEAGTWNPGSGGLFGISFTTDPGCQKEAIEAVLHTVENAMRDGFDEALVRKAVRQALVAEINVRKTVSGQASRLGLAEIVAGDLHFARAYFSRLAAVTPDDLKRLAEKYLRPEKLTVVSLNPNPARRPARSENGSVARRPVAFEEKTCSNGARLVSHHNEKLPNLHFRLVSLGGASYEASRHRGSTALLSTLLTRDTEKRRAEDVADAIESLGGTFEGFCGNNTFGLVLETLPVDAVEAADLLEQAVLAPLFNESVFEREKAAQLASLHEEMDDVLFYGMMCLRARFFGDHPLCIEPSGTPETVRAIALKDMIAHYRRLVTAENVVLGVAGDLSDPDVLRRLEAFLERIPARGFSARQAPFDGPPEAGAFSERVDREQAVVMRAFPDCGIIDPGFPVGEMIDELFSGMSSRLFERVREELGLAYYVGSGRVAGLHEGMFYLYAGTHPDKADAVAKEMDAEVCRVRDGDVSEDELQRCRIRLKARKRMAMQTNGARAMQAALNVAFGLPVNDWLHYDEKIDAVTVSAIKHFARKRFREDRRISLLVGPR